MRVSQKDRVLAALTRGPLCATTLLDMRIPRGAARISDLKAEGWIIDSRTCQQHSHDTRQIEYVLVNPPQVSVQPDMAHYTKPPEGPLTDARLFGF
jgi:hypothetical protein